MRRIRLKALNELINSGLVHKFLRHEFSVVIINRRYFVIIKAGMFGKTYVIDDETTLISNIDIEEFKELFESQEDQLENLNEVLPKYKVTRNGNEVAVSTDRINIMSDYTSAIRDSSELDRVEVLEEGRVISSTIVKRGNR